MEIGASIFFTDYSITPAELATALEERDIDSVWVAEHTHRMRSLRAEVAVGIATGEIIFSTPCWGGRACYLGSPSGR